MEKHVSLRAALGFGKLWKSTEELMVLTGMNRNSIIAGVRELQNASSLICENYQDGHYMYCMAARRVEK